MASPRIWKGRQHTPRRGCAFSYSDCTTFIIQLLHETAGRPLANAQPQNMAKAGNILLGGGVHSPIINVLQMFHETAG